MTEKLIRDMIEAGGMNDDTREYFESIAHKWDEMRRMFFGEGVRNAAIAAAGIKPSDIVADVGVGTGFLAEGALAAGARVIGIDSSEGMLTQARGRFAEQRFETRAGEIDSLPLRTAEVDVVLANMVLHHAADPPRAIHEMSRVLKLGGRLVITDADTHNHEWLRTEQHDQWLGFDRADIARWFREAGLVEVTVADTSELCCPTSECGVKVEITIFLARGVKPSE
jgi:ubiquinone/menaquinone biosynthesis C-methylase UbiE